MRTNVFWVPGAWPGRLGILARPRGGDWLDDEAAAWRQAGIGMVVSLLEPEEAAGLGLANEEATASLHGVAFRMFSVPDRDVPASTESVTQLCGEILDALANGLNVGVHCRQGIGRSGLVVAAVLMAVGVEPDAAVHAIAQARGVEIPETAAQREWLNDFSSSLGSSRVTQHSPSTGEVGYSTYMETTAGVVRETPERSMMHDDLLRAISEKRLIAFVYRTGRVRIVEPHDYGIRNDQEALLGYQISGESRSGQAHGWKRFDVGGILQLRVLERHFPGTRADKAQHHREWDVVFGRVT